MQSPKLSDFFQQDSMIGVTTGVHSTISYEQMSNAPKELEALKHREKKDRRQWRIHCISIIIVSVSQVVNLLRGSPKRESIIGIQKCGKVDWIIVINYLVFISCMTLYAVTKVR